MRLPQAIWRMTIRAAIEVCYMLSTIPYMRGHGRLRNLIIRLDRVGDRPFTFRRRGIVWELFLQNHSFLDRQLMFSGAYERVSTELIEGLVKTNWQCVDVG